MKIKKDLSPWTVLLAFLKMGPFDVLVGGGCGFGFHRYGCKHIIVALVLECIQLKCCLQKMIGQCLENLHLIKKINGLTFFFYCF